MPQAAIIGAALTDASAHPYNLEVGGVDLIKVPGGTGLGVDLESIVVNEIGPGGVSSMSFVINDPQGAVSISSPLLVTFKANDGAVPETIYFRGWVSGVDVEPAFGGQGKLITVRCDGIEQLLDWYIVPPSFQMPFLSIYPRMVGVMASLFAPALRGTGTDTGANMLLAPWTRAGSFSYPIGNFQRPTEPSLSQFTSSPNWTSPGTTLRNAILGFAALNSFYDSVTVLTDYRGLKVLCTVDWWYGLRLWEDDPALQPDDYTTLTVTDTYASSSVAASLRYAQDWAGVTRSAYVIGSSGTDYGVTTDGSGVLGRMILVNDTSVTSSSIAQSRGLSTIGEDSPSYRGDFQLGPFSPATTVHAGGLITITDATTGLNATHRIMEIEKTFLGNGQQTWRVTFGGLPRPRVSRLMRRFTRVLN